MIIDIAGHIVLNATFWGCWVFVAVTSFYWPWWKTELGWSITVKSVAIALALVPAELRFWFPAYRETPPLEWLSISAVGAVPLILAWRATVIWRYQRNGRKEP